MANLKKIRDLLEKNKVTIVELSKEINFTTQGLQKAMKRNTISIAVLEKIASYFKVPVGYFFDESEATGIGVVQNGHYNIVGANGKISVGEAECWKENERLKEKVKGQDELIKAKDEIIRLLKK